MSANLDKKDSDWVKSSLKQGNFYPEEVALFSAAFDEQTDYDAAQIEKEMKQKAYLKNVCLSKIVIAPLEYIVIRILLGKDKAKEHRLITKLYKEFYKDKITLTVFKNKLKMLVIT